MAQVMDVSEVVELVEVRRAPGRRPRIVRQRGVSGLWESAHSLLYRLLVAPLR